MNKDPRRNPRKVAEMLLGAGSIAICTHVNPDGDTIGSALAMRYSLLRLGKKADVYCQDKVPDQLLFLPGAATVKKADAIGDEHYDLLLCVDISEEHRMGECSALTEYCDAWIQIDHHMTNPGFAQEYDIDGYAPANCILIYEVLQEMKVPINREISMCLYAGISTDTGNFAFSSTNSETFGIMAELMKCDLPLQDMNRILFRERSREQLLLMGKAIANLKYLCDGKLAVTTLRQREFAECGALPEHADTIVNLGLETVGTCMSLLCRENGDGKIKCSLRAVPPYRVDSIAVGFGGGGHGQAAGISMNGTLEEITERVSSAMVNVLNG